MPKRNFRSISFKKCNKNAKHSVNCKKYCFDIEGGNCCENARLIGYPCHKGTNQKFHYNKTTKQLIAKSSNKCLEINKNGIIQKKCNPIRKSQKFTKKQRKWISVTNKKTIDETIPLFGK